jgi:hypothetical protein
MRERIRYTRERIQYEENRSGQTYPMGEDFEKWLHKQARTNLFRMQGLYDFDDFLQDAHLVAYACQERYGVPGVDIDPPHFMRLLQRMMFSHIGEIVRNKRRTWDIETKFDAMADAADIDSPDFLDRLVEGSEPGDQEYNMLLAEMPPYLRRAVDFLAAEPEKWRKRMRVRADGPNETMSERLARFVGWPAGKDFETELRSWLWEREHLNPVVSIKKLMQGWDDEPLDQEDILGIMLA